LIPGFRGFHIDCQLELGRLLDRHIRRLRALDNIVCAGSDPTIEV
jgi:hypothetical protein